MTKRRIPFFVFLLLLLLAQHAQAQVEVVAPPDEEETETIQFDTIPLLQNITVQERKIPDSLVKRLQQDEAFWYANMQPAKKAKAVAEREPSKKVLQQDWIRMLFWFLIIGGFAAVLIWYLSSLNIRLFRKPSAAISQLPDETVMEDIFSIAYETEIAKAIKAQNYRQAIRLYYLETLSLLSKKGAIDFQQDRTNSEYVMQLYNTALYKDFFYLTRHFEYTWYGKFELSTPAFEKVQKEFKTFYRQFLS